MTRYHNQAESVKVFLKPEVMEALGHLSVDRQISKGESAAEIIEQALSKRK